MIKLILKRSAAYICMPVLIMMIVSSVCGQARRGNRTTARSKSVTIRSVDFLNRTYPAECADGRKVRVVNGAYAPPANSRGPYWELHISVTYGDLTGDGQEEAVVIKTCDGAVGSIEDGTIYAFRQGRVAPLANIEYGNRGDGGNIKVKITGGLLVVERNVGQAACCAELREMSTYRLVGRKLSRVGQAVRKLIEPESKPTVQRIEFAAGSNSATIEGTLEPSKRVDYLLRANKGQKLDVKLNVRVSTAGMIVTDSDERVFDDQTGYGNEWHGLLPSTGDYKIVVVNLDTTYQPKPSPYTLEVSIH